MTRQIGPTLQHLPGRRPIRPLALVGHLVDAAPGVAGLADGDGIAQRLAVAEHEIKSALGCADHDGAGLLIGGIAHHLARDRGTEQAREKRAAAARIAVVRMSRGRRGGSAQHGDDPSRYDCDDLHDAIPLCQAPGRADRVTPLFRFVSERRPLSTIPRSGSIAGGMAPEYLSPRPVEWFKGKLAGSGQWYRDRTRDSDHEPTKAGRLSTSTVRENALPPDRF